MVRNNDIHKINKFLTLFAVSVYMAYIVSAIFVKRSYYADGTEFLLRLINQRESALWPVANDYGVMRIGCNILNQSLAVLAIKLGVKNVIILQILYSIPLFLNKIIGIVVCYYLLDNEKSHYILFPIANYVLFDIVSEIFILNQSFTATWLYWILFFAIIHKKNIKSFSLKSAIAICIILLPFAHETTLMVAIILLVVIIVETIWGNNRSNLIMKSIIAIDAIGSIFYNYWFLQNHQAPTKDSYFKSLLTVLNPQNIFCSNFLITLVLGIAILIFIHKTIPKLLIYVLVCFNIVFPILIFALRKSSPFLEFQSRCLISLGVVGTMICCYIFCIFEGKLQLWINYNNITLILLIALLGQSIWQIGNNIGWFCYLNEFGEQLSDNKGYITDSVDNKYAWAWTSPGLSLLEADSFDNIDTLILPRRQNYEVWLTDDEFWIPYSMIDKEVFDYSSLLEEGNIKELDEEEIEQNDVSFEVVNLDFNNDEEINEISFRVKTQGVVYHNAKQYKLVCYTIKDGQRELLDCFFEFEILRDGDVINFTVNGDILNVIQENGVFVSVFSDNE